MDRGAVGLIVGTSSRMWLPEARTDNFFTRPNAMPRMRDNAMHYDVIYFFLLCSVMLSPTVLPNPFQHERPAPFLPVLWNLTGEL